jgi:L-lactate dehydrogenase complex protein LldG
MSSREKILSTVAANQPAQRELPPLPSAEAGARGPAASAATPTPADTARAGDPTHLAAQFTGVLESIGGAAYFVSGYERIATILREQFPEAHRIISNCPQLPLGQTSPSSIDPHTLEDVDLAILPAHFGVAENGACWITESQMLHRALPFITQHLALVIRRRDIVADMHQAYDRIALLESAAAAGPGSLATTGNPHAAAAAAPYGFATFIAGPSKTADIEQSLVLGAHGPMSLTVFLLDEQLSDAGFY